MFTSAVNSDAFKLTGDKGATTATIPGAEVGLFRAFTRFVVSFTTATLGGTVATAGDNMFVYRAAETDGTGDAATIVALYFVGCPPGLQFHFSGSRDTTCGSSFLGSNREASLCRGSLWTTYRDGGFREHSSPLKQVVGSRSNRMCVFRLVSTSIVFILPSTVDRLATRAVSYLPPWLATEFAAIPIQ